MNRRFTQHTVTASAISHGWCMHCTHPHRIPWTDTALEEINVPGVDYRVWLGHWTCPETGRALTQALKKEHVLLAIVGGTWAIPLDEQHWTAADQRLVYLEIAQRAGAQVATALKTDSSEAFLCEDCLGIGFIDWPGRPPTICASCETTPTAADTASSGQDETR